MCFVKGGGDKHFGSFSRESIVFSTLSCNISLNWLEFVKICQKIFFSKIFFSVSKINNVVTKSTDRRQRHDGNDLLEFNDSVDKVESSPEW